MDKIESTGNIIIYQTEDGLTKINVKLENDTVLVEPAANGGTLPKFKDQYCGTHKAHIRRR